MGTPPLQRLVFEAKDNILFQGMLGRVRSYDGDPRPNHNINFQHHLKYKASTDGNLERQVRAVQAAHNMACEVGLHRGNARRQRHRGPAERQRN
eukprot:16431440-Heterocapsa_arctica.AAC.1